MTKRNAVYDKSGQRVNLLTRRYKPGVIYKDGVGVEFKADNFGTLRRTGPKVNGKVAKRERAKLRQQQQ